MKMKTLTQGFKTYHLARGPKDIFGTSSVWRADLVSDEVLHEGGEAVLVALVDIRPTKKSKKEAHFQT